MFRGSFLAITLRPSKAHPAGLLRFATFTICLLGLAGNAAGSNRPATAPAAGEAQAVFIDFLHPEAFLGSTWIHVTLPSNRVLLNNLRILTANRQWALQICGSVSNPGSCVNALTGWDPRGAGWRGDFRDAAWSLTYQDLDAGKKLHLKVTPQGGDWMIFRIQLEATPTP